MEVAASMWVDRFSGHDNNGHPLDLTHPINVQLKGEERQKYYDEILAFVCARDADWMKGA